MTIDRNPAGREARGYRLVHLGTFVIAAIAIVTVVKGFFTWQLLNVLETGVSSEALPQLTLAAYALQLIAGALFVTWLWRAWTNAELLGTHLTRGRGWTIGSWFIPLANLVLPYLSVREVVQGSVDGPRITLALRVWWTSFVAQQVVVMLGACTDQLGPMVVGSQLLLCVAAVSVSVLIYTVSQAQDARIGRERSS